MHDLTARHEGPFQPPSLDEPAPRQSWLRVEIHFSSLLLFYGAVYGVLGALMLYYNDFAPLPFMEKVGMVIPFVLGPPVIAGLGWLQLLLLGWITRVLGDMA